MRTPLRARPTAVYASRILEHAVLNVRRGREADFEEAFDVAKDIIAAARGFKSLQLSRGVEDQSRYLLLVEWDTLEDHVEGFRGSDEYREWRRLLHHFYDPFPTVDHYAEVVTVTPPN